MNTADWSCLSVFLCLCLLCSGCILHRTAPESPCAGQAPIVGAWTHDPAGNTGAGSEAVYLYIFKESGRFDAIAFSGDPTRPLSFEDWISGSWTSSGFSTYNLTGENIRHDFSTDSHESLPFSADLRYFPARDILYGEQPWRGVFIRVSCEPQVPLGMNVTIPWD
jgi:hypothetical protein